MPCFIGGACLFLYILSEPLLKSNLDFESGSGVLMCDGYAMEHHCSSVQKLLVFHLLHVMEGNI